jgi:hypothetical protein
MIKKCSLAVIGKVSAPASRIQDNAKIKVCMGFPVVWLVRLAHQRMK